MKTIDLAPGDKAAALTALRELVLVGEPGMAGGPAAGWVPAPPATLTLEIVDQAIGVFCGDYFLAAAWGEPFGGLDGEELRDVVAGRLRRAGWDPTAPDAPARAAAICAERSAGER
jgi:hypothetical protein